MIDSTFGEQDLDMPLEASSMAAISIPTALQAPNTLTDFSLHLQAELINM